MPLALTCDCGARFEVEDALAGQEVSCPECQQPLRAPAHANAPPRTSHLALASAALALAGAFTVVGTLAAVGLGATALVLIARRRDRLTGAGFATFGVVAGLAFTTLTLFALSAAERLGVGAWVRQRAMADRVDTSGSFEIDLGKGWSLSRPSEHWGRLRGERSDDPAVYPLQKDRELILLDLQRNAYVDVRNDAITDPHRTSPWELVRQDFQVGKQWTADEEDEPRSERTTLGRVLGPHALPQVDGWDVQEFVVPVHRGGRPWRFLVRVYRKGGGNPVRLVRGYTPARRFQANEAELRRALDSFRLTPATANRR